MVNQIQEIEIRNLWGRFNYKWELNPDVNILAGLNGSGKSSVLQIIDAVFSSEPERLKEFGVHGVIRGSDFNFSFDRDQPIMGWEKRNFINISHFNIPPESRKYIKDSASFLDVVLDSLIYTRHPGRDSFHSQHLNARSSAAGSERFIHRTEILFEVINKLFDRSGKKLLIDPATDTISILRGKDPVMFTHLSSGEKQLLIILFQVFLLDEQPSILLLDEPENSLHIEWQHQLINVICKLNPNSQLIISTHSPSIFGDGWGDKLFFLEDMILD